jgi:putative protease
VAYSGQCFTSESIGGRSANRGQCAQSCRFEYDMIVDGKKIDLKEKKYLVSPKDLCGIEEIPELLKIGIDSFKVEGRLKTPEYVASAAKNYRNAINLNIQSADDIQLAKKEMGLTYSRGFYSGWLHGVNHQMLIDGTFGAHRGVEIGNVLKIKQKSIIVKISEVLKKGDGILFAFSTKDGKKIEVGGKIYDIIHLANDEVELFFSRDFDISLVKVNFKVYLNHDDAIEKQLTKSYQDKKFQKKIPLDFHVIAEINSPLKVSVSDGNFQITIESESLIELAQKSPMTQLQIKEELTALSQTCFACGEFNIKTDRNIFINQKELKVLRRKFTEELMHLRVEKNIPRLNSFSQLTELTSKNAAPLKLNILLRDSSQVDSLLTFCEEIKDILGIIYLDFEFGRDYSESVIKLKDQKIKVGIATTRILRPNEYHNFKVIERANPDVILCRNLGAVQYFFGSSFELRGDYSLNVSNSIALAYLVGKKLTTICASYDLNAKQLEDLVKKSEKGILEITVHQYMPSFHMEHCVFAAFLSTGSSYRDCGKPCEKHRVELKDQFGNYHQIKADQECRNTMFNSKAFSFLDKVAHLKKIGVSEFRFEALYENESELKEKISHLKSALIL